MSTTPQLETRLRGGFKYFNRFMLWLWRLGLGGWVNGWPAVGGRIMVLTHEGRRSKLRRQTPLNYAEVAGELYCVAGFGPITDWVRNVMANPRVEVWLANGSWQGMAEDLTGSADSLTLIRAVLRNSGFAAYAAGINPWQISDDALRQATQEYRLVHIQRLEDTAASHSVADLAWVWPLTTFALLFYLLIVGKKEARHDDPS
ncbi:MAG: nitroreductase family deazaflavin-dependent oxidoreductase [Caldilineaceae bacterium]